MRTNHLNTLGTTQGCQTKGAKPSVPLRIFPLCPSPGARWLQNIRARRQLKSGTTGSSTGHTFSWLKREMASLFLPQIADWIDTPPNGSGMA